MNVLIVESDASLSSVWANHIERMRAEVDMATSQADAVRHIRDHQPDAIVLSLDLANGSALAVADFASYRCPDVPVVFVTRSSFFSDGSIFKLVPNTAAYLPAQTRPEDLAAIVEHHASRSTRTAGRTPDPGSCRR